MVNYQKAKLYALRSYQTEKIYVGSTCCKLSDRFSKHKNNYKDYLEKGLKKTTSRHMLEYDDCYIELIKKCPCDNKEELRRMEGDYIREHRDICVNAYIAGRTKKECDEDNKDMRVEYSKKYYQVHKDDIKKYQKDYAEKNKDKINTRMKIYREKNKDKKAIIDKAYREKNKDAIKARRNKKIDCECGLTYSHSSKARHLRTKTHQNFLNGIVVKKNYVDGKIVKKGFEEIKCDCGTTYRKRGEERHFQSKKHQNFINGVTPTKKPPWAKVKITCECGAVVSQICMRKHKKRQTHIDKMKQLNI